MSEGDIENIAKLDSNFSWEIGKNVMIFGADMSPSVDIDNKSKICYFLVKNQHKD